jgi:hypothetical protein
MQIYMDLPNIVYYIFFILISSIKRFYDTQFPKTSSICIKNCCLNKLFAFYIIFGNTTAHKIRANSYEHSKYYLLYVFVIKYSI